MPPIVPTLFLLLLPSLSLGHSHIFWPQVDDSVCVLYVCVCVLSVGHNFWAWGYSYIYGVIYLEVTVLDFFICVSCLRRVWLIQLSHRVSFWPWLMAQHDEDYVRWFVLITTILCCRLNCLSFQTRDVSCELEALRCGRLGISFHFIAFVGPAISLHFGVRWKSWPELDKAAVSHWSCIEYGHRIAWRAQLVMHSRLGLQIMMSSWYVYSWNRGRYARGHGRRDNRQTPSVLVAPIGKLELKNNAKWSREAVGRQTIAVADITSFEYLDWDCPRHTER